MDFRRVSESGTGRPRTPPPGARPRATARRTIDCRESLQPLVLGLRDSLAIAPVRVPESVARLMGPDMKPVYEVGAWAAVRWPWVARCRPDSCHWHQNSPSIASSWLSHPVHPPGAAP